MSLRTPPAHRKSERACAARVEDLGMSLVAGDAHGAETIVHGLVASGSAGAAVLEHLVEPAMTWVGERWERAELTVADEHLATAIAHEALAVVYEHLLIEEIGSRGSVLLAAVQGEQHVLGLRMVADVLEGAGYVLLHLGADVPTTALLEAVDRHGPAVVGLSATLTTAIPQVEAALLALKTRHPTVHVLVGGAAGRRVRVAHSTHLVVDSLADVRALVDSFSSAEAPTSSGPMMQPATRGAASSDAELFERATSRVADLSRRHARRAQVYRRAALEDQLTGLWNRRAFDNRMFELSSESASMPLAMLMLDLDRFKTINDTYGHDVGDQALEHTAACIRAELRAGDFAARLGGDEFAILLPSTDVAAAVGIAERIRDRVAETAEPAFTVSIGVKECDSDIRATIIAADTGLYQAKGSGRNAVCAVA